MKVLVLAGGFPQIALINELKKRGLFVILADYNDEPVARSYADKFFQISTLDISAIRELAQKENVDFLITVCTDQALLTVAQISEELKKPCYIDYKTALNVTNKSFMKQVMTAWKIPTAKYKIASDVSELNLRCWQYPLVVKPVDCNSSKGVIKVTCEIELHSALGNAITLSRTNTAIVEEYIEGKEISVDVYVENGVAKVLDITTSEKLDDEGKFVIFRTWHPARISASSKSKVEDIAQKIADAFGLHNSPMLIQMIVTNDEVYVIEFSARTGGGVKHLSIMNRCGFDVVSAVVDLTLGKMPSVDLTHPSSNYLVDEYIYCIPGVFDHLEGFDKLKDDGYILDYYLFRSSGSKFDCITNSGDRIAGFSIEADSIEELNHKHIVCNSRIKAISTAGTDLIRHDLLPPLEIIKS